MNTSNTPTFAISARSAPNAARSTSAAATSVSSRKAKSRFTACKIRSVERRLRQGFAFGRWDRVEIELEGCYRRVEPKLCQYIWMQLAKHAEGDLRPELERARAAWMKPGWSLPRHGEVALVDAEGGKRRNSVGLGGEHVRFRRFAGPVTA